ATDEQVNGALATQSQTGKRLGEILLDDGVISEQLLAEALADQYGLRSVDLARLRLDRNVIDLLPADLARRLCAIGVRRDGERVEFAVADPILDGLKQELIDKAGAPVRLLVAARTEVMNAIDAAYVDTGEIGDALRDFEERFGAVERRSEPGQQVAVDENAP